MIGKREMFPHFDPAAPAKQVPDFPETGRLGTNRAATGTLEIERPNATIVSLL